MKEDYLRVDGALKTNAPYEFKVAHITARLKEVHGDKFGFDDLEYIDSYHKVKVWCTKHQGHFYASVTSLYKGFGCGICLSNSRVESTEQFIEKSEAIHGEKYNYGAVDYQGTDVPVEIYCRTCNEVFFQKPHYHAVGSNCPKCSGRFYKFLYLLRSEKNSDLYKIGISNNPVSRIKALARELGQPWETLGVYHFEGTSAFYPEQEIHFVLAAYRYKGSLVPKGDGHTEVFKLPKLVACEVHKLVTTRGGILLDG